MFRSLYLKTIWDRRAGMVWWLIGSAALTAITVAFYPAVAADQEALAGLVEAYPEELLALIGIDDAAELVSPVGFVNSQLYANVVPIVLLIFGIGMGTAAIAGEEERRTMDLLLANPLPRRRVVLESFAAIATLTTAIVFVILLALAVGNPLAGLELSFVGMVAANVGVALLGLVFATLALAVGALTGRRGATIGISAGAAVASFFLFGLAPLVEALAELQKLSPFYWYLGPKPLANGFDALFLWMIALIGAFLAAAVWAFERRDISV
jgi:ABC-2 type transport system permease protein